VLGLLILLAVTIFGMAYPPPTPPAAAPEAPRPMEAGTEVVSSTSPLDEPLRLIDMARQTYRGIRDYQCRMIKQERIDGKLQPRTTMAMSVRTEPFSVHLRWEEPRSLAGQEACYVAGRNNGKLRARGKGLLGAVGFVTLEINDPKVRANSRHAITEAGVGNLIEEFGTGWERERQWNQSQVRLAEYQYDGRRCTRVVVVHADTLGGRVRHYRDVVYFDKETHLPIRLEAYDWPRPPGEAGDLLEMYSYAGMRFNVGLGDEVFNR
jgi:hypothetical protein